MNELFKLLNEGNFSLVVRSKKGLFSFTSKGVADLYNIIKSGDAILFEAEVADKIIGKGAAVLMIKGGVKSVITHTLSSGALKLFKKHNIEVQFEREVPYIINRTGDGWCPVETICRDDDDIELLFQKIEEFIEKMRKKLLLSD